MGTSVSHNEQRATSETGNGSSHLYRSYQSLYQQPDGQPQHSQNGDNAQPNTNLTDGLCLYTETDPLLPDGHHSGSMDSETRITKNSEGCDAQDNAQVIPAESVRSMVLQILVPFLLAGLGTVSAGMLLDVVQHWEVFQEITEIFILVPAVLGLKGNLEMTLASRLSTAVNAGKMESAGEKWSLVIGNLALKQVQATVLGLLAALMAIALGWMVEGTMLLSHAILLCSTSVATAFMASLLQGVIMVGVILSCKKMGINPDNVATPMAASFGDIVTLAFLACLSDWFYKCIELYSYVLYLVVILLLCLIPVWAILSAKHPASRMLLFTSWEPIITAMVISSIGGLVLDTAVSDPNLTGIIVYAPVINGVGGNLVSIQCSRIATDLHLHCSPGEVTKNHNCCNSSCHTFCGSGVNHRSAQLLLLLVIPGQLLFLYTIHLMKGGHTYPTPVFIIIFLSAALIQVFCLLCLADWLVHCLWRRGKDPDSYSIPYLTALGDLLGTALLSLAFLLLWCLGDPGST
ncbi:solute carrier family 41 member 2 [Lampris incognitus]|uniref:solute carrier family 41 member 2 n=1 Tax=Lampris incognitus TaxID=2546036 RepID=UPI0024B4FB39|nr:solute carrier family 41 member 2 [Lampris incognitus]